jgi:hypothetical protein
MRSAVPRGLALLVALAGPGCGAGATNDAAPRTRDAGAGANGEGADAATEGDASADDDGAAYVEAGGDAASPPDDAAAGPCESGLDQRGCGCAVVGETRACYTGPAGTQNLGTCHDGTQTCLGGGEFPAWGPCTGDALPSAETCTDGLDANCNGKLGCDDAACVGLAGCCAAGDVRACYDGPNGTAGVGSCRSGTQTCDAAGAWGACTGEVLPTPEWGACGDHVDQDCNGAADCLDFACLFDAACKPKVCTAGATRACYDGAVGTEGVGACHGGTQTCAADGASWGSCVGEVVPVPEGGHCADGLDQDCNGRVDCADRACSAAAKCCVADPTPADGTIWANSSDTLYRLDPVTFAVTKVGKFGAGEEITDIALTPAGALYGISFTTLYAVDKVTAKATARASVGGSGNNALAFLANGTLIAADSGGGVKTIDPTTGQVTGVGAYGSGFASSGDLVAVSDGTMYGTSSTTKGGGDASGSNVLLLVDSATGVATAVGPTGHGNVWGLAYAGARVIGLTTAGEILGIDPQTGASALLASTGISFWGATQSPLVVGRACP